MPPRWRYGRRIFTARGSEIGTAALYGILRLRAEVFVVEQDCAYLDPDGCDLEPTTTHLWVEDADRVVACARVLENPGVGGAGRPPDVAPSAGADLSRNGSVIGRVVTAPDHRRRGIASTLVREALDVCSRPAHANAQSHLVPWYERFGFEVAGDEFVEDGIPHTPMVVRDR